MKKLILLSMAMLSINAFSLSYSSYATKPKRPPINDDGPSWPPDEGLHSPFICIK